MQKVPPYQKIISCKIILSYLSRGFKNHNIWIFKVTTFLIKHSSEFFRFYFIYVNMKSEIVFIKIIGYMFYSQYNYHISHHNYQFSFLSITLHVVEKPLLQQLRNLNLFVSRSTFALTEPRRALQPKGAFTNYVCI